MTETAHKKYQLYDLYDFYGEIGSYDTLEEAHRAAEDWKDETDGECDLIIRKWNEAEQRHIPFANYD